MKGIYVNEIGSVRHKGKTWVLGVSALKKDWLRGRVFTPTKKGVTGAIVISSHLPACKPRPL